MNRKGFSLMEVMVTVVIVGILAAVAIPSYLGYVTRTRRAEAVTALQTVALYEEKAKAESGSYVSEATLIATYALKPATGSNYTPSEYYDISVNVSGAGNSEFIATATPGGTSGFTDVVGGSNPYTLIFAIRHDGSCGLSNNSAGTTFSANDDLWKSLRPPSNPF